MVSNSTSSIPLITRLQVAAKQDPKKALMLTVLAAVLLVLWGRMMLSGGGNEMAGPARAAGSSTVSTAAKSSGSSQSFSFNRAMLSDPTQSSGGLPDAPPVNSRERMRQ